MKGIRFTKYKATGVISKFDEIFALFQDFIVYSSGDIKEALDWIHELNKQFEIFDSQYQIKDFISDLSRKGHFENDDENKQLKPSHKFNIQLRSKIFNEVFGNIKKGRPGNHTSKFEGQGDENSFELKPYQFGDDLNMMAFSDSIKNAQIRTGHNQFMLEYNDLSIFNSTRSSSLSSVLCIDISHSMILYGEDRITPAKKVALALSVFISTYFPKDTLDIVVFGDDAWQIDVSDLPYLEVGPYHTNTSAALDLSLDILNKKKTANKQVFIITDGKPTCIRKGRKLYKNSTGLDREIIYKTLSQAHKFKKMKIPITTFMITKDSYFEEFVKKFTTINGGKAFYSDLSSLGSFVFKNYGRSRKK